MTHFFVDGQTEQNFVSKACKNSSVRLIGCNGDKVAIPRVVERIVSIYRTMRDSCGPIVVILDREGRNETSEQIAREVKSLLASQGIEAIVGIPDRSIETWMLYDSNVIPGVEGEHEGIKGATLVKEKLGAYTKSTDGPELLKKCRASELRASASFRALADELDWMNCWWLKK